MSNIMFQSMSKAKMIVDDYVGRRDATLCLDVNTGSRQGTYFLLGAPCSALSDINMVSGK